MQKMALLDLYRVSYSSCNPQKNRVPDIGGVLGLCFFLHPMSGTLFFWGWQEESDTLYNIHGLELLGCVAGTMAKIGFSPSDLAPKVF